MPQGESIKEKTLKLIYAQPRVKSKQVRAARMRLGGGLSEGLRKGARTEGSGQPGPSPRGRPLTLECNEQSDWRAEIPWCSHPTQKSAEGLRETGLEPMQRPPKPGCVCPQGCPRRRDMHSVNITGAAALCPWRSDPDRKGEAGASLGTAGPSLGSPWKQGRQVFTVVRLTQ